MVLATTLLTSLGSPLPAHEFWISPERYQIAPGEAIIAELRVGENLSGAGYPYIPARANQHYILQNGVAIDPGTRMGDRPALDKVLETPGLAIIVHETADSILTYRDWKKFAKFTTTKDLGWAQELHIERGLPETGFRESYRRYGKALVGVGQATGSDQMLGLLTEVVALANPYTDTINGRMPLQVFAYGVPRVDAQVEVFARDPEGEVTVTQYRTDSEGKVSVPVTPDTEYLIDSVLMEKRSPSEDGKPVWHSIWASLSFKVPG